jgi:hypothetical protein
MANKTDFQVVDISMKITNQLPKVIITDELMVTVNNRKNNILNIQAMAQESEKKKEDEMAFMTKLLQQLKLKRWIYRFLNIRCCTRQ